MKLVMTFSHFFNKPRVTGKKQNKFKNLASYTQLVLLRPNLKYSKQLILLTTTEKNWLNVYSRLVLLAPVER